MRDNFLINAQMRALLRNGSSVEEIALAFEVDPEAVRLALEAGSSVDLADKSERYRQLALDTLADVMQNSDSPGAKVAAAKVMLDGRGIIPPVNAMSINERLKQMRRVVDISQPSSTELVPA